MVVAAEEGIICSVKDDSDKVITTDEYSAALKAGNETKLVNDNTNYVCILHPDGTYTEYVHLAKDSALVKVGDKVEKGQPIGKTGWSGYMTAPHLHFNRFIINDDGEARTVESIQFEMIHQREMTNEALDNLS